jgi:hypothetical protein
MWDVAGWTQACDLSMWEAEARRSLVRGQPGLHRDTPCEEAKSAKQTRDRLSKSTILGP